MPDAFQEFLKYSIVPVVSTEGDHFTFLLNPGVAIRKALYNDSMLMHWTRELNLLERAQLLFDRFPNSRHVERVSKMHRPSEGVAKKPDPEFDNAMAEDPELADFLRSTGFYLPQRLQHARERANILRKEIDYTLLQTDQSLGHLRLHPRFFDRLQIFGEIPQRLSSKILKLSGYLQPTPTGREPYLPHIDGVRAVIFDVYGTLFISGSGDVGTADDSNYQSALARTLTSLKLTSESEAAAARGEDLLAKHIHAAQQARRDQGIEYPEIDIREIWRNITETLQKEGLITGPLSHEILLFWAVSYECRTNPVFPMPGMLRTLRALQEHPNAPHESDPVRIGIVSNAQFYTPMLFEAFYQQTIEEFGFDPEICVWSYREQEGKPSIALYERLLRSLRSKYNILPHETLYVGNDMLKDIWPASKLGMRTALFAGDSRSLRTREDDERCFGVRPDMIVTDLTQIPQALRIGPATRFQPSTSESFQRVKAIAMAYHELQGDVMLDLRDYDNPVRPGDGTIINEFLRPLGFNEYHPERRDEDWERFRVRPDAWLASARDTLTSGPESRRLSDEQAEALLEPFRENFLYDARFFHFFGPIGQVMQIRFGNGFLALDSKHVGLLWLSERE